MSTEGPGSKTLHEWEDEAPTRSRDRHLWMWGAAPAFAAIGLLALGACCLLYVSQPRAINRIGDVERITGVQFPAGSRLVQGTQRWGTESSVQAQVMIPRGQVKQFVSQPLFSSVWRNDGVIQTTAGRTNVTVTSLAEEMSLVKVDWIKL